mgnify:CR=1 FL=1
MDCMASKSEICMIVLYYVLLFAFSIAAILVAFAIMSLLAEIMVDIRYR